MQSSLLIFGSLSWPSLTRAGIGLIRPDVTDARKSAIVPAIAGDFLDWPSISILQNLGAKSSIVSGTHLKYSPFFGAGRRRPGSIYTAWRTRQSNEGFEYQLYNELSE
jgi:hypothetical protein